MKTVVIIPALNEERSVAGVVCSVKTKGADKVIVVDNGSSDSSAQVAANAGALVVSESKRGYGAACLAGIAHADDAEIIVFMDADGADDAQDFSKLVHPIRSGEKDFVIACRAYGTIAPGAMTIPQRFGNWLATSLIYLIWGVRYGDLGPFRAIRKASLDLLQMEDRDFGWTVEMQIKAIQHGLRIEEISTDYFKRIGTSKISGTIKGTILAGYKILFTIFIYGLLRRNHTPTKGKQKRFA